MPTFWIRVRAGALGLTALIGAVITASALSPASGNGAETATTFSGSSSGAIVAVHNTGTGQAISATGLTGASTGVIYATTSAAGSSAIRGFASATSGSPSFGIIGVSKAGYGVSATTFSPTLAALFATNLSTTGPAIKGQSPGNAVTGISRKANGVVGQTSFASTMTSNATAGVLGQDMSASSFKCRG